MDEFSIVSTSDDKVCKLDMRPRTARNKRPHFTIDWRRLTYFHGRARAGLFASTPSSHDSDDKQAASALPILSSLDGRFKSGQLSAILGPSGAGKSTFLSVLFGNKQESAFGHTKVSWFEDCKHERPIDSHVKQRPIRMAFLPQHDNLLNHLSVYETLMFASKIKNATRLSEMKLKAKDRQQFHRQNVKRVAEMLKLVECLKTRCGRLSGGQYKRVSIGQELLSEPDVIILDEPTSGLDAMTCLATIKTLKSIAVKHPISIILTIHQPDIDVFNLFDHVYVIAQGGRAIYEGPPNGVVQTLARANLHMPSSSYNPARFIVENAFLAPPESGQETYRQKIIDEQENSAETTTAFNCISDDNSDDSDDEVYLETNDIFIDGNENIIGRNNENELTKKLDASGSVLRKSLLSIADSLKSSKGSQFRQTFVNLNPLGNSKTKARQSGRMPLLNIGGVKTFDGKLITSNELGLGGNDDKEELKINEQQLENYKRQKAERLSLLKRLNEIQKSHYYAPIECIQSTSSEQSTSSSANSDTSSEISSEDSESSSQRRPSSANSSRAESGHHAKSSDRKNKSKASAHNYFIVHLNQANVDIESDTMAPNSAANNNRNATNITNNSSRVSTKTSGVGSTISYANSASGSLRTTSCLSACTGICDMGAGGSKLRRDFDKRLSAKHINSKQRDYPIYYHSYLLTHRTWLSIVRDPIFFGIQFCMHTTIPILLALIFGSHQEEGCPRLGQFDLVDFAYQDDSNNFIMETMHSIRQSIGNIGVIFFEMFVLSFAINCITALVFPLDMHVLLKEYRNGWYSLRSYFIGRTLADLPVPIVLHSLAMGILYFLTGQPAEWWRFVAIIIIVIVASLVAQSVGLTIGALLMQSSQSAVLAAAGIVAPFFALSGFIVRIHTLPWLAQWAAQISYLHHLLNGFIVMRYGFGRCRCEPDDFSDNNSGHKIPERLRTMASMWIGSYSNEYSGLDSAQLQLASANGTRSNVDPNIDLVDKLAGAFKAANSYGHKVDSCDDALPYAMLEFNLRDIDIWASCAALLAMLVISRLITFGSIYYKIRSFA